MLTINDEYFNKNNEKELKEEEMNEQTFIYDMVKQIKYEDMKELKESHKQYEIIVKSVKQNIYEIIKDEVVETQMSTFQNVDGKIKIVPNNY